MSVIAITGATGFIGRGLVDHLTVSGQTVHALTRGGAADRAVDSPVIWRSGVAYDDPVNLASAIAGADTIIHLADAADRGGDSDATVTVAQTLCHAMKLNGQRRVIVASSVYARLAATGKGGAYGDRKATAEAVFLADEALAPVILRLPPVYGPGVGGGFGTLVTLVRKGLPVPFGKAYATRDYLSLRNLSALMAGLCAASEDWPAGAMLEPCDGRAVSTRELVAMIATAMGLPNRTVSVPLSVLQTLAGLAGKHDAVAAACTALHAEEGTVSVAAFCANAFEAMPESLSFLRVRDASA